MPLKQQAVTEIAEEQVEDSLCSVNSLTQRCRVRRAEQLGQGLLPLSAKAPQGLAVSRGRTQARRVPRAKDS